MKPNPCKPSTFISFSLVATGLTMLFHATYAAPPGTAFTYQGRLVDNGSPANGNYDLRFALYDALSVGSAVGVPITNAPTAVSNGLFTVTLDFGGGIFLGEARWLEMGVRTNGSVAAYDVLSPRQQLTPTPYAITAENVDGSVPASQLTGTLPAGLLSGAYGNAVTLNNAGNSFSGNGGGLTSLNASQLTSGTVADARLSANVALLNGNQTFTGLNIFSGNISLLDPTKSITFPATAGANSPMMNMFASGTGNADRMVIAHSPSFPTYGLQYQDASDKFNFLSFGTPVMTVDLTSQRVYISSRLGIGTASPFYPLDVVSSQAVGRFTTTNSVNGSVLELDNSSSAFSYYGAINFQGGFGQIGYQTNDVMTFRTAGSERVRIDGSGNVRLNDNNLFLRSGTDRNHGLAYSNTVAGITIDGPVLWGYNGGALGAVNTTPVDVVSLKWDWLGNVWISNNCSVATLTIRGGADLAEPFNITSGNKGVPQGAVMVIDDQNPGHLKLSDQPYDTRVAGVVSGANGVNPGIQMQQQGLLEGGRNVALTGRVYVQADASKGAIKPGDLLTTSSMPGYAMKVANHAKAQGAILGKAMTGLSKGKGMVLVLVTLQ